MALVKFTRGANIDTTKLVADAIQFDTQKHVIYLGTDTTPYGVTEAQAAALSQATTDIAALQTLVNTIEAWRTTNAVGTEDNKVSADAALKEVYKKAHEHSNKTILDAITQDDIDAWNAKIASVAAKDKSVNVETKDNAATIGVNISTTADNALTLDATGLYVATPAEQTDYSVTVDGSGTPTEGAAKTYTISQLGKTIGTIDIPKDMVVSSGVVETYTAETAPEDPAKDDGSKLAAGTYIVLTLANATSDKIYIPADSLIEYVTSGSASTDKVQLAVDANHKITATIKAGSIEKTDLTEAVQNSLTAADNALPASEFTNIGTDKLSEGVVASLGKADSALQASDITTGKTDGTISVKGTDVKVASLGSAAYTEASAYATAEQGKKADSAVQKIETGTGNGTIAVDGTDVAVKGLGNAAYTDSTAYTSASDGETMMNALTWGTAEVLATTPTA